MKLVFVHTYLSKDFGTWVPLSSILSPATSCAVAFCVTDWVLHQFSTLPNYKPKSIDRLQSLLLLAAVVVQRIEIDEATVRVTQAETTSLLFHVNRCGGGDMRTLKIQFRKREKIDSSLAQSQSHCRDFSFSKFFSLSVVAINRDDASISTSGRTNDRHFSPRSVNNDDSLGSGLSVRVRFNIIQIPTKTESQRPQCASHCMCVCAVLDSLRLHGM